MSNTTATATGDYVVLLTVKVRGFATAAQIAESCGLPESAVQDVLTAAVDAGEAKYREGRVTGYTLTASGRARLVELRAANVSVTQLAGLRTAYDAFLEPNAALKQLTTDWQLANGDDSTDFVARLARVHEVALSVVALACSTTPRYCNYQRRFDAAYARVAAGDQDALAKPMTGSYHDVWMELHEDLLSTLGLERTEHDG